MRVILACIFLGLCALAAAQSFGFPNYDADNHIFSETHTAVGLIYGNSFVLKTPDVCTHNVKCGTDARVNSDVNADPSLYSITKEVIGKQCVMTVRFVGIGPSASATFQIAGECIN